MSRRGESGCGGELVGVTGSVVDDPSEELKAVGDRQLLHDVIQFRPESLPELSIEIRVDVEIFERILLSRVTDGCDP